MCGCGERRIPYDSKGRRRKYINGHKNMRKDYGVRTCIDCESTITPIITTKGGYKYEQWRKTNNENEFLCLPCYDKRRYYNKTI